MPCPICGRPVPPRKANPAFPFCSERCKLVDLGKWLGDEYRVPTRPGEGEDEGPVPVRGETPEEDDEG